LALDADTKLIPSFIVGKRDAYHTKAFIADLIGHLEKRVQFPPIFWPLMRIRWKGNLAAKSIMARFQKPTQWFNLNKDAASRYSPAEGVSVEKTVVSGMQDVSRISTSHIEKQNHTLRMHSRRFTRLTNAFSKKLENFEAAVSLNFAYYNFVKTHSAIRVTPPQAGGVEKSAWTVAELVERCDE
jgi:hypothetical protein